jgi:antirestriction protein ArdC
MKSGPQPSKRDLRQEITDQIVRALEQGTAPWQKPWQAGALELPFNPATGPYRGKYPVDDRSFQHGYEDSRWLTYRQAHENGWRSAGREGHHVEFWQSPDRIANPGSEGKPMLPTLNATLHLRVYTVSTRSSSMAYHALLSPPRMGSSSKCAGDSRFLGRSNPPRPARPRVL